MQCASNGSVRGLNRFRSGALYSIALIHCIETVCISTYKLRGIIQRLYPSADPYMKALMRGLSSCSRYSDSTFALLKSLPH